MKILYVLPFMQVPPHFGMGIRDYNVLSYLAERHQVVLASFETEKQGDLVPWARNSLSDFVSLGRIESPSQLPRFAAWQRLVNFPPSALVKFRPVESAKRIQAILDEHPGVDIIVFETLLTAQARVHLQRRHLPPCVAVLLDDPGQYAQRQFRSIDWRPFKLVYLSEWIATSLYERRILSHFSNLVTVSSADAERLQRISRASVFLSPNGVDTDYFMPEDYQPHQPPMILFVASFGYGPNVDAFLYMHQQILPRIWMEVPSAQFAAVGPDATAEMKRAAQSDSRILIPGRVDDLRPWYRRADVVAIPLRFGSGVKLKTLEAFASGVPVISTSVGCEGITVEDKRHLSIADDPQKFANQTCYLLSHPDEARQLISPARQLVETQYDWKKIVRQFEMHLLSIVHAPI